ncbi:MAG: patatin-like phospholipase family protein [Fibrobacteria bacterium]|nr:patatin-like phospholipase family protein [Fibrobacteria bacterium]
MTKKKKLALVLFGGGARSAYQAGVLRSWQDLFTKDKRIDILYGVSAGTINTVKLAEYADNLAEGIEEMNELWSNLHTHEIFDSNLRSVVSNIFNLTRSSRKNRNDHESSIHKAILSTNPFYQFLLKHFDIGEIHHQLNKNPDQSLAINCFDYSTMKNITFFQGSDECKEWNTPSRTGRKTIINTKHIMASCAIPFIFPTINIDGGYYGDGSLRNIAPLAPAIKLGAERILCINLKDVHLESRKDIAPTLGNVAEAIFESSFMDSIDYDTQVLDKINRLSVHSEASIEGSKVIDLCVIKSKLHFGKIAQKHQGKFPKSVRYLLGGWMSPALISYLMFDGSYCNELMDQGFRDGHLYRDTVQEWLE